MPIFEFHCAKCGHDFESLVLSNNEKVCCPECGGKKVDKLMSGFAHKSEGGKLTGVAGGSDACTSCSGKSCSSCH